MVTPKVTIHPPGYAWGYTPANELFRAERNNRGTYTGSAMQGYLAAESRVNRMLDWSDRMAAIVEAQP